MIILYYDVWFRQGIATQPLTTFTAGPSERFWRQQTAMSFSHCCQKHGNMRRHLSVRIQIIGVQIIKNPLYMYLTRKGRNAVVVFDGCESTNTKDMTHQ